jgi:outer membrane protein
MTLRQALDLALQQNPDIVLARLDEQRARYQVDIAHVPFSTRVDAGSGLAYAYGFPSSIEGTAPAIAQVKTTRALYDKPQSYQVAQAKEAQRGFGIDVVARQEEVAYQVASLFLDAENAARSFTAAQRQAETLALVKPLVDARVREDRELSIESDKANLAIRKAQQHVDSLGNDVINFETSLALVLGLNASDRVHPAEDNRAPLEAPVSEEAAISAVLESSPELKRLESNLQAKTLEIKGYKAQRQPRIDLVAQYSLLAPYDNYKQYFARFQYNNFEFGASISIPVLAGPSAKAYISQGEIDARKLREEVQRTRGRLADDIRRAFQEVRLADESREVARLDLDVAVRQVGIDLALVGEGKLSQAKLEQDRAAEDEKWQAYYESQTKAERARLDVLHRTGTILTAVK